MRIHISMHHKYLNVYLVNDFTITASAGLYCDGQGNRNLIQSISSIGSIFGLYVVNWISDAKGRKTASILGQSIAILSIVSVL